MQQDLLREFSLHDNVTASVDDVDGMPVVKVETHDAPHAVWDVRATIGMFDDDAVELTDQG